MTGAELKAFRKGKGLSAAEFARAVGLVSKWAGRTVRKWEAGTHPIPQYVIDWCAK